MLDPFDIHYQANVLIDENAKVKLTDFGTAVPKGLQLPCPPPFGALPWRAPELIKSKSENAVERSDKNDIYSFGCLWAEVIFITASEKELTNQKRSFVVIHPEPTLPQAPP